MQVRTVDIQGLLIIEPKVYVDSRGYFFELYNKKRYEEFGVTGEFVQDNRSKSKRGVLRGLHFQKTMPQGKLVTVTRGEVYDVAVDLRSNSKTFGQHYGLTLTEQNKLQFYVPPGFAHGYCVLSEEAEFQYKCTEFYWPEDEGGIIWNDPLLKINWPISDPEISEKDRELNTFEEFCKLPVFD